MSFMEVTGDIWSYVLTHRIIIPTNQAGVMGAGLALAAKQRYPGIQTAYQQALHTGHDKRMPWSSIDYPDLILAPTKRHWRDKSRLDDLATLLTELSKVEGGPFALPEMGCGLGGLAWSQTAPLYSVFEARCTLWVVVHPLCKTVGGVKMYQGILR